MKIKAVIFDLDDTLFPERDYVVSGFAAVEKEIESRFGIEGSAKRMTELFDESASDVYGRFLRENSAAFTESDIAVLKDVYRRHEPRMTLRKQARRTLLNVRASGFKIGVITDGRAYQQRAKMRALKLSPLIDAAVVTDELGGEKFFKPCPKAFEEIAKMLSVLPEETVYVGDNPQKDFAVKKYIDLKTVQLLGGMYSDRPYLYGIEPDAKINSLAELLPAIEEINLR